MFNEFETLEVQSFEKAVFSGDAGLVGADGSGNDWEFVQDVGSTVVDSVFSQELAEITGGAEAIQQ